MKNKKTAIQDARAVPDLIAAGRRQFKHLLGHTDQQFTDGIWNLASLVTRSTSKPRQLMFTRFQDETPLPTPYADVIKSWIVIEGGSPASMWKRLRAAKFLWEALCRRREAADGQAFMWETLCETDLSEMETMLRSKYADGTVCQAVDNMISLADFLTQRSICRPLYYTIQTPWPGRANQIEIVKQAGKLGKLPSRRALDGLADLYHNLAVDPPDRLMAAAMAILVVTGFRIGELLTLPEACEVEEERHGRKSYGLRYYKEKARGREYLFAVRWLTPLQAELARKAIAEIRQITAQARARARVLEASPDRIPIPGYTPEERINSDELAEILGFQHRESVWNLVRRGLPRHKRRRIGLGYGYDFIIGEVESYLLQLKVDPFWTLDRQDGSKQLLSETLLIIPRNFYKSYTNPMRLLVEPVTLGHVQQFLAGRSGLPSAFERFKIREEDGTFCRLTSHQFRHWLNDLADKGGLPVDVLSRWMGRENPRDTEAYRHATVDERLQWVKQGIKEGSIQGTVAHAYLELPLAERDDFLDGQVQAVHLTPMGICVHDFAIEPCPYHLNCVRGCPDYLRRKGNSQERRHLLQIQADTEKALASARRHMAETGAETAQAWVSHHEEMLQGIKAALAVDGEETVPDGAYIKPEQLMVMAINEPKEVDKWDEKTNRNK